MPVASPCGLQFVAEGSGVTQICCTSIHGLLRGAEEWPCTVPVHISASCRWAGATWGCMENLPERPQIWTGWPQRACSSRTSTQPTPCAHRVSVGLGEGVLRTPHPVGPAPLSEPAFFPQHGQPCLLGGYPSAMASTPPMNTPEMVGPAWSHKGLCPSPPVPALLYSPGVSELLPMAGRMGRSATKVLGAGQARTRQPKGWSRSGRCLEG